ncbi:DUF885 domain-containing protein [Tsukamurella sp. 8F]|uniref:DUF885 domain-containing protein n=1 Tax=unclassified Tsukamurella TaxID=2633480 RepID=UPI0023B91A8A|nr:MULTISPECIES: DUF885 domain-containing protein [unclassified Tsukamurella]MDF0529165.1 DUF885 domain-containing protein [Tsukamurella sp. 8J]MDF0585350.1 DUF885 domain-containing protein [Tsukamurella sp. 8F]
MSAAISPFDALAERYAVRLSALDPIEATNAGAPGNDDALTDYSPEGAQARADLARDTLRELDGLSAPQDPVDRVTAASLRERLGVQLDLHAAGRSVGALDVIASPLQDIRDVFDLMAAGTPAADELLLTRLGAVPGAVDSAIEGLRARVAGLSGDQPWPFPALQVREVTAQARAAGDLVSANLSRLSAPVPDGMADSVRQAFARYAGVLHDEIAPLAVGFDEPGGLGVGREAYPLHSRAFLGTTIDVDETYAWGQELLAGIVAQQAEIVADLYPELTGDGAVGEALRRLDSEERYTLRGTDALRTWMQEKSDAAVSALTGTHFDIPEDLTRLACRIAPSASGGIYYTAPSADLIRPGTMWWSVPKGQDTFHTWQETTTVYHEGVPGHHLQIGQAVVSPRLNRWRKLFSFTSGHGEGWALYAERLMADLGFLDDPGERMGMLDSQRLRAARVVLDIGVHCGLEAPTEVGGGAWNYDKAWTFLTSHCAMDREVLRFELHRYLGWPGQAPSYSIGQRVWESTRDAYLAAHTNATVREFHTEALALGGLGLDTLTAALS